MHFSLFFPLVLLHNWWLVKSSLREWAASVGVQISKCWGLHPPQFLSGCFCRVILRGLQFILEWEAGWVHFSKGILKVAVFSYTQWVRRGLDFIRWPRCLSTSLGSPSVTSVFLLPSPSFHFFQNEKWRETRKGHLNKFMVLSNIMLFLKRNPNPWKLVC